MKEKIDSQSPDGEISVGVIGTDDAGDSERRRISSSRISSKLADNKLLLENVFEDLERFDFPSTVFFSSTDRSRFGAAQTLTGMTRRPSTEKSLKTFKFYRWTNKAFWSAVGVVQWSACLPSLPTIGVGILQFFCKIIFDKNEYKQKRPGMAF